MAGASGPPKTTGFGPFAYGDKTGRCRGDPSKCARRRISATTRISAGGRSVAVVAWAGPWPTEERWWDRRARRRRARFQLLTGDGLGCLAVLERGRWQLTALWD